MDTRCPACPLKLATAFWPGEATVSVAAAPPGTSVAAASGEPSSSCKVMLPEAPVKGCTTSVCTPGCCSAIASRKLVPVPTVFAPDWLPSGSRTEMVLSAMVEPVNWAATRVPAGASNTSRSSSPLVVTVTGGPPGEIAAGVLPVTESEAIPAAVEAVADTVVGPEPAGTKLPVKTPSPRAASAIGWPFTEAVTVEPGGTAAGAGQHPHRSRLPGIARNPWPGESITSWGRRCRPALRPHRGGGRRRGRAVHPARWSAVPVQQRPQPGRRRARVGCQRQRGRAGASGAAIEVPLSVRGSRRPARSSYDV